MVQRCQLGQAWYAQILYLCVGGRGGVGVGAWRGGQVWVHGDRMWVDWRLGALSSQVACCISQV